MVQKSTFKLTKHELDFISDPVWMSLKQQVIRNVGSALEGLGEWVMQEYFSNSRLGFKITRGENYQEMPYVVLDAPQLKANELNGKLRIMFWWGHYISLQYFIETQAINLNRLKQTDYVLLTAGDLFNNALGHSGFTPVTRLDHLPGLALTKICTQVPFTEMERMEEHVSRFMGEVKAICNTSQP